MERDTIKKDWDMNEIIVCKENINPFFLPNIKRYYKKLTIGKHYKSLTNFYDYKDFVVLIDDSGVEDIYPKQIFYVLQKSRDIVLTKLGIL
jgi:hypothetical protein